MILIQRYQQRVPATVTRALRSTARSRRLASSATQTLSETKNEHSDRDAQFTGGTQSMTFTNGEAPDRDPTPAASGSFLPP